MIPNEEREGWHHLAVLYIDTINVLLLNKLILLIEFSVYQIFINQL